MLNKLVLIVCLLVSHQVMSAVTVCEQEDKSKLGLGIPKISWESEMKEFKFSNLMGYQYISKYKETDEIFTSIYALNSRVKINKRIYKEFRVVPTRNKSEFQVSVATFSIDHEGNTHMTEAAGYEYYKCISI